MYEKGTSFPVSPAPVDGQTFYRTDTDILYIYDGATWQAASPGSGTVNSGTAGNLALYPTSTPTVSDTYVQNTKNITVGIAAQGSRTQNLAVTVPNPGNAVTAASVVLTEGDTTINGATTLSALLTSSVSGASVNNILLNNTTNTQSGFISQISTSTVENVYLAANENPITNVFTKTGQGSAAIVAHSGPSSGVVNIAVSSVNNSPAPIIASFSDTGATIKGTTTNDSAAVGYVGEYVVSSITASQNFPTSNQYGDATSISLTAGDWDLWGLLQAEQTGATWTYAISAISITSGNFTTGITPGLNRNSGAWASSSTTPTVVCLPVLYRLSLSATTTVYLKMQAVYSLGQPIVGACSLVARRVR